MVVIWKIIYWLKQILKNAIKYHIRSETPVWELRSEEVIDPASLGSEDDTEMAICQYVKELWCEDMEFAK